MYDRIATFILRHSRALIVAWIAFAAVCAVNLPRLGFDFTPQQLFRGTSDAGEYREVFAERFGREDNLVFLTVQGDDVLQPEVLRFLRDFTLKARDHERVKTAESVATMSIPRTGESPGVLATDPIVPPNGEVTADEARRVAELTASEPLVRGQLVAESGQLTAVLIWIHEDIQDVAELGEVIADLETLARDTSPPEAIRYQMGGVPYLRVQIVDELRDQQLTFVPLTGLAYVFLLLLLFRRLSGVLPTMGVVGIASLMLVSLMVLTGSSINIINNVLPSLIFIIGVSDSIHMLVRDAEETERGAEREESIRRMVTSTGGACLLTSTTTAVGFFSLLSAETEILENFGWQAGAGVMFAYFVTLLFLPAVLRHMRPVKRASMVGDEQQQAMLERGLVWLGERALARPRTFIAVGLTITAIAAGLGSRVVIDTVLLEVFEEGHPVFDSTVQLERELSGVLPIEISLESDEDDTFKDPELFAKMHEVQQFAIESDVVLGTQSIVDFHQAARAALLGDPAERGVMPQSREQVEQIHLLIAGPPDERLGVNRYVTPDFRYARILLRVRDAGAQAQLRLGDRLEAKLDETFEGTGVRYRITGDAYVASAALDSFIRDLFTSLLFAMVIIFGMMTFVFRSLKIGLISIIPNLVPLILTFGYMGATGVNLNTTTIIIFAISLGLAVDDTIHFLARFREEQEAHPDDIRTAILRTYNGAGRAILITSVMLLVGLVVLLLSSFVPTQLFGRLTAITIFGAVLGDLLILPPILYLIYRRDEAPAASSD